MDHLLNTRQWGRGPLPPGFLVPHTTLFSPVTLFAAGTFLTYLFENHLFKSLQWFPLSSGWSSKSSEEHARTLRLGSCSFLTVACSPMPQSISHAAPLSPAPLPTCSPTHPFLHKAPSTQQGCTFIEFHPNPCQPIWQFWRQGLCIFFIFFPSASRNLLCLVHYHRQWVNISCLTWRHTVAGICPKPGVSETIAGLTHSPTLAPLQLFSMVTHAGLAEACIYSTCELRR